MATVNNVRLSNLALTQSLTVAFRGFYELTRAMKKAGWKFKASSNGTTKVSSADPAADQWGAGVTLNTGGSVASIATPVNGRATITGLTGIVAADKGRFLLISGATTGANNNQHQIEEIISSTSVKIDARNFAVASDASNGALTWVIKDPLGDTFNNTSFNPNTIAWWCAQGPSILKIPITAASVGSFTKGENVVQSTTLAEGELLGYTYYNGTGWLVIAPRVRGSGGGVYGWATGNTVTGGRSGATVSQNGTALDYVWEVVFAKPANQTTIQILVGQFNTVADSAELFSFCATQAGCTATVHPGGGGTGNAFGTHAWVMWGTNSTPTFGVAIADDSSANMYLSNANVICVDALPEQNYTADGSWTLYLFGNITTANGAGIVVGGILYGLHRLNDIEDGEVSPYVSVVPPGVKTLFANNRTSGGTQLNAAASQYYFNLRGMDSFGANVYFAGWRGRGLSTEAFVEFDTAILAFTQTAINYVQDHVTSKTARLISTANLLVKSRERIWLANPSTPYNIVKGSFKWLYWVSGDQVTDTYSVDPGWVQLGTGDNNSQGSTLVLGPYDGTPWCSQPGPN